MFALGEVLPLGKSFYGNLYVIYIILLCTVWANFICTSSVQENNKILRISDTCPYGFIILQTVIKVLKRILFSNNLLHFQLTKLNFFSLPMKPTHFFISQFSIVKLGFISIEEQSCLHNPSLCKYFLLSMICIEILSPVIDFYWEGACSKNLKTFLDGIDMATSTWSYGH